MPVLHPLTICCSQSPLLLQEAVDSIRAEAKEAGFLSHEVLIAGSQGFSWDQLFQAGSMYSFFAEKKVLELRIPTGKPGQEGAKALQRYCQDLPSDVMTMIVLPEISWQDKKSAWFKTLVDKGHLLDIKTPALAQLPQWILTRLKKQGQTGSPDALSFFASQVEGNLMAAHQEILKLGMLYPEGELSLQDVQDALSNFSRYRSDQLSDAFLQKNYDRYWQILEMLKQEGEPLPLLLWRLSEDSRTLYKLLHHIEMGQSVDAACKASKLFYERKSQFCRYIASMNTKVLVKLIKQFGFIDQQIKGLSSGSAWETLRRLPLTVQS